MDGSLEYRQEGSKKYSGSLQGHLALEGCGKDGRKTLDLGSVPMTNTGWPPPLRAPNISRAPGARDSLQFPLHGMLTQGKAGSRRQGDPGLLGILLLTFKVS